MFFITAHILRMGKVMFWHVSVFLFTGGGGTYPTAVGGRVEQVPTFQPPGGTYLPADGGVVPTFQLMEGTYLPAEGGIYLKNEVGTPHPR